MRRVAQGLETAGRCPELGREVAGVVGGCDRALDPSGERADAEAHAGDGRELTDGADQPADARHRGLGQGSDLAERIAKRAESSRAEPLDLRAERAEAPRRLAEALREPAH